MHAQGRKFVSKLPLFCLNFPTLIDDRDSSSLLQPLNQNGRLSGSFHIELVGEQIKTSLVLLGHNFAFDAILKFAAHFPRKRISQNRRRQPCDLPFDLTFRFDFRVAFDFDIFMPGMFCMSFP